MLAWPMLGSTLMNSLQSKVLATDYNPDNSDVADTIVLLKHCSHEEVATVMEHEHTPVQNRDTLIITITATLAG